MKKLVNLKMNNGPEQGRYYITFSKIVRINMNNHALIIYRKVAVTNKVKYLIF